jgi:hypothetical protein
MLKVGAKVTVGVLLTLVAVTLGGCLTPPRPPPPGGQTNPPQVRDVPPPPPPIGVLRPKL